MQPFTRGLQPEAPGGRFAFSLPESAAKSAGPFDLNPAEKEQLRALWHSAADRELLLRMKDEEMELLAERLRYERNEEVLHAVQSRMDALDAFFERIKRTVEGDEEGL